ncbi:hypothetical protein QBZ16_002189 [Prototheca wickerhamii]|uniref:Uncharacterized protein n=1 Tax=Prototheca wickerhamii TaxID=3111 RepID=A0AAD9IMA4_PROWI|nr:hypothetical protein QBZ16_002189 [Prototheca wickerhamii]
MAPPGPKSRREGLALRKGTGRQAPRVAVTFRLRPENWDPSAVQKDPEVLKDALLFQAQRRRAAELAGLLRPGTGRHHARQTIGLVLPPYVPTVAPVVAQTPDRPVEVFDARCSPVKAPDSEALQVAADASPSPRALATPAGPPSETRSITRMEGVPEWPTVRKPGSATAGRPTTTPALPAPASAPRFTPMEGEGATEPKTPYAALQRAADGQPAALEDGPGLATALSSDDDVPEYGDGWGGDDDDAQEPLPEQEALVDDPACLPVPDGLEDEEEPDTVLLPRKAAPRRPSQRHSPGHRLRNELGKRKSLVGAPGVGRVEVAPGVRRSSRQREKPLMWTMPTVKAIIHHDPNTPWQTVADPFPGKRRRAKAAMRLDGALEAAAEAEAPTPDKGASTSRKKAVHRLARDR